MTRIIILLNILIGVCLLGAHAQSNGSVSVSRSSSSSSSSVSASASYSISSTSFSSSLTSATQKSITTLESNPNNLNTVLENIAEAILTEIEKIATAIYSIESEINSEQISIEMGAAVNASLSPIVEVKGFESLDVESVVAQVESAVLKVIEGVTKKSSIEEIAEDLANAVIEAIGNGFSEVTGAKFSFKVQLSTTTTVQTPAPTPAPTSSLSVLLEAGKTQQIVQKISKEIELSGQTTILEFFISAVGNETLRSSIVDVFVGIFADSKFPMEFLVDILGPVYELNSNVTFVIEEAIIKATEKNEFEGLSLLISLGLTTQGPASTLILQSIEGAITTAGCTIFIADALAKAKGAASDENAFQASILSSAKTSSCLTDGLQNQISFSIISKLQTGDIDIAFESLKTTQVSTVVTSFVLAINAGYQSEVSELLVKFFEDETATAEKLTIMITTFLKQESFSSTQILIDAISKTTDLTNLIATFKFAFLSTQSSQTEEFVALVSASISGGKCGLSDIVEQVLANSTTAQVQSITSDLVNGGAEACVPLTPPPKKPSPSPTPTPAPEQEVSPTPTPTPAPVDEVSPTPTPTPTPMSPTPTPAGEVSPTPTPTPADVCDDATPPGGYSCEEQAKFGKCDRQWMKDGGFCKKSCGFCCDDVQPKGNYTCAQQKKFGKCQESWMIEGKFCRNTCGNCGLTVRSPVSVPSPEIESTPSPTPAPTPSPVPIPHPPPKESGVCDCGCGCGCGAEFTANLTATIVRDVVTQVLKELKM